MKKLSRSVWRKKVFRARVKEYKSEFKDVVIYVGANSQDDPGTDQWMAGKAFEKIFETMSDELPCNANGDKYFNIIDGNGIPSLDIYNDKEGRIRFEWLTLGEYNSTIRVKNI